jgi:hypothetical protein
LKPQILFPEFGRKNSDLSEAISKFEREVSYKDLSTIILFPALGAIPTKVVHYWMNMIYPPNQKTFRFPAVAAVGMEVGEAYSHAIDAILQNPNLNTFRYILTIEHDNCPDPDGLIKLLAQMEAHPELDCIGGLYWVKGEAGIPQIWGDIKDPILNFRPQAPIPGQLVECCGTGMGFNLWRMDMFRDARLRKPWFKTVAEFDRNAGSKCFTQDLWFWEDARKYGHRCAIDCSILVGHYDQSNDLMW